MAATTSDGERGPRSSTSAAAVTSVFGDEDVLADATADMSGDEAALAALGYRQEFRREFGPWSTFAVSFAVMGLLPSIASTMWYGIGYGACVCFFLSLYVRPLPLSCRGRLRLAFVPCCRLFCKGGWGKGQREA